ncbi:hypothetical protein AAFF_G00099390 [Aldrovandia affinis]|uniref:Uncharacterized protein n=1 Tax=Aldrovandia affinis TaxID=143900 RepID=A0AAD7WBB1_9TELE|nr:hypothetical protein AAFF_G00099390 [Aldrovandia affinis]
MAAVAHTTAPRMHHDSNRCRGLGHLIKASIESTHAGQRKREWGAEGQSTWLEGAGQTTQGKGCQWQMDIATGLTSIIVSFGGEDNSLHAASPASNEKEDQLVKLMSPPNRQAGRAKRYRASRLPDLLTCWHQRTQV